MHKRHYRYPAVSGLTVSLLLSIGVTQAEAQSPYRLSWEVDGPVAGTGALLGAGALAVWDNTDPLTLSEIGQLSREDVNRVDRGATWNFSESASSASDWLVYTAIVSPLALMADTDIRSDWQTYLVMYAETMLLTGTASQLTKGAVPRTRPFVYNPNAPIEPKLEQDARKSFYSSHTAFAFASAVFLSVTLSDYLPASPLTPYVWAGSLMLATATGVLRYSAGAHYPTDILVGAAVGSAVGYLIPWLHRRPQGTLSVIVTTERGGSVGVLYRF